MALVTAPHYVFMSIGIMLPMNNCIMAMLTMLTMLTNKKEGGGRNFSIYNKVRAIINIYRFLAYPLKIKCQHCQHCQHCDTDW